MKNYLVAYDIRDPRRWRKVYACLKDRGVHLQYSVFLVRLSEKGLEKMMERLSEAIDHRSDDVRVYPIPERPDWVWIGPDPLPEAVYLLAAGRDLPPRRESGGSADSASHTVSRAPTPKSPKPPCNPLDQKENPKRGVRTKT